MNKIEIVAGLKFMNTSAFESHPAFDLFADELSDANLGPEALHSAWYYFREGWELGASGAGHDVEDLEVVYGPIVENEESE